MLLLSDASRTRARNRYIPTTRTNSDIAHSAQKRQHHILGFLFSQATLNGTRPCSCNLRCTSATGIVVSQRHGESIRCVGGGEIALLHPRHFSGNASGQAPSFSRRVTIVEVHVRLILAKHLAGGGVESAVDDVVLGPEANSVVGVEEPDVLRIYVVTSRFVRRGGGDKQQMTMCPGEVQISGEYSPLQYFVRCD